MPSKTRNIKVTDKNKAYNRHKQLSKIPLNSQFKLFFTLQTCEFRLPNIDVIISFRTKRYAIPIHILQLAQRQFAVCATY